MDLWIACELVQASVTMVHVLRAAGSLTASFTALAETLIEGQQIMDEEHKGQTKPIEEDFEEEFYDEPKKQGFLQRIWAVITNK